MKRSFVLLLFLSVLKFVHSQNSAVFSELNISAISTGILYDKELHFVNWEKYNGVFDTLADYSTLSQLYAEIYNSFLQAPASLPGIFVLDKQIQDIKDRSGLIPLVFINYKYNQIKPDAVQNNLLTFTNGKFHDVPGRPQSPYNEKTVFAVAPALNKITSDQSFRFVIKKEFFFTQNNNYPSQLQIDFGDGNGYRTVNWNDVITVRVNQNNLKTTSSSGSEIIIKTKAVFPNQTLNSTAVISASTCSAAYDPDLPPWPPLISPKNPYSLYAAIPWDGVLAIGNAYVKYRTTPIAPGEQNKFSKPVIFVEGLDMGQEHSLTKNGTLGWCELIGGDKTDHPELGDNHILLDILRSKGYDIIIVDFYDGADYIQRNAMLLVEIINMVNKYKAGTAQNIVIGGSMGGQVAKYALSYMEKNGLQHCTRDYISFDSPQNGANIPLGLQYMLDFFAMNGPKVVYKDFMDKLENGLNRPAPKQLLVNHYTNLKYPGYNSPNNAASLHNDFYDEIRNKLGYPTKLRKVAIANGSGNAIGQGYNKGEQLFDWNILSNCPLSPLVRGEVYATANNNIIFNGRIVNSIATIACSVLGIVCTPCYSLFSSNNTVFAAPNSPPWDNCPGGVRFSFKAAAKDINKAAFGAKALHDNHSFIPTISSLDVNTNDLFFNVSTGNIIANHLTPFENFYAPTTNQPHVFIDITSGGSQPFGYNTAPGGNGEWAVREILQNENTLPAQLTGASPNAGVYNFGRRQNALLTGVTVSNGGKLYVNANRPTDFGSATTPQIPGGTTPPTAGSSFTLQTCDCSPVITIEAGGQLSLGDASTGNKATVIFHAGSRLHLKTGSKLILSNGSKLLMETGSQFILEPGAEIQLIGPNALIEVQGGVNPNLQVNSGQTLLITKGTATEGGTIQFVDGTFSLFNGSQLINDGCKINIGRNMKLFYGQGVDMQLLDDKAELNIAGDMELAAGAQFTFTYPGRTSGFVSFSRIRTWDNNANPHLIAGTGASMVFVGANKTDKVLEITQESLYAPDNLSLFKVEPGLVALGSSARLNIPCPLRFVNATLTSVPGTAPATYRGIHIFGQPNVVISNSLFENGATGVSAFLFYLGSPLSVSGCTFRNMGRSGVYAMGKGVSLNNCTFSNCSTSAVDLSGLEFPSSINSCTFTANVVGLSSFVGKGGIVFVNKSVFSNHSYTAMQFATGTVVVRCSKMINNSTAVDLYDDAVLNAASGYNDFSANRLTFTVSDSKDILLDKGFNNLNPVQANKFNCLTCPTSRTVIYGIMIKPCGSYPASNNLWNGLFNTAGNPDPLQNFSITTEATLPLNCITYTDNSTHQLQACPSSPVNPFSGVPAISTCANCPVINTSAFANVNYNDAVKTAVLNTELVDSTKNDIAAIDMLKQILMLPVDSSNPDMLSLAAFALSKINTALNNLFATGKLTAADNASSLHPSVQQVIDVYNRFKTTASAANFKNQFYLDMGIGQIERLAGRRDLALAQFASIDNCFLTEKELKQIKDWTSLTFAENQVLTGVVAKEKSDSVFKPIVFLPAPSASNLGSNAKIDATVKISSPVNIGNNVQIAQGVVIGANVTIGNNVQIKKNAQVMDGVVIKDNVMIDESSIIGKNTVIGTNTQIKKQVVLGNDNSIGSNVSIDMGVKTGNLVSIGNSAHIKQMAQIGDGSFIESNVTINQNSTIGSNVVIQTNAQVQQQAAIGDGSVIGANANIGQSVRIGTGVTVAGNSSIGNNAKVSDGLTVNNNLGQNASLGNTTPTPPSPQLQNTNTCAFAKARAKKTVNYFNGFAAANADTAKHNFVVNSEIRFKGNSVAKTYLWNFGDCTTSTEENPIHVYANPGTYVINLTLTIKCVSTTFTGAITVYPLPISDFTYQPLLACDTTGKVLINKSNFVGNLAAACSTTQGTPVQSGVEACSSVAAIDSSLLRVQFNWDFGTYKPALQEIFTLQQLAKNQDSLLVVSYPVSGTYPVTLTASLQVKSAVSSQWSIIGVGTQKTKNVISGSPPAALFELPFSACATDSVVFNNFSSGGFGKLTYRWKFSNNITSTELNPKVKFGAEGTYTVQLLVSDSSGCKDSLSREIFIPKCPAKPISGVVLSAVSCGSEPVAGDTLVLLTSGNALVNTVTPALSDFSGMFFFNGDELALLDSTQRYRIAATSGLPVADTTSRRIKEWIEVGSLTLNLLPDFPDHYFTKLSTGDIVSTGNSTGSAWGDYDGDGDLDVIAFGNPQNALYRNDCNGNFTSMTSNALTTPTTPFNSTPSEWMDYDNDGDLDILLYKTSGGLAIPQSAQLYQNDGAGNFTQLTTGELANDTLSPRSASVVDYDNDGYLDVFVANRNRPNVLYKNTGAGDFTKVTGSVLNSLCTPTLSQGSTWGDYDNDGDMDVYIGGGGAFSCFYNNNGDGTFAQINDSLLTTVVGSNYGPAWVDYDNDADLDLFLQIAFAPNLLFMNNNNGTFTKVTVAPFLHGNENAQGGPTFGDYDNDGDLDLFLANVNGHRNRFYVNNGNGTFTEDTTEIITNDLLKESFAATFADIDNDGDLDLYVNNVSNPYNDNHNFLYQNKGSCNKWLKVKCIGSQTNKQAVGARVYVKATINGVQTIQMREINGNCNLTGGANGVTTNEAHFGLGDATIITELKIVWPKSGITQLFSNINPNMFYDVTENNSNLIVHSECETNPPLLAIKKRDDKTYVSTTNTTASVSPELADGIANNNSNHVKIYPNPNKGTITIEIEQGGQLPTEFRLCSLTGQLVYSKNLTSTNTSINLIGNGIENGIYFFTITSNGTIIKQDKLVVMSN